MYCIYIYIIPAKIIDTGSESSINLIGWVQSDCMVLSENCVIWSEIVRVQTLYLMVWDGFVVCKSLYMASRVLLNSTQS